MRYIFLFFLLLVLPSVNAVTISEGTTLEHQYDGYDVSFVFMNDIEIEEILIDNFIGFENHIISFEPSSDLIVNVYNWTNTTNLFGVIGTSQDLSFNITDGVNQFNISTGSNVYQTTIPISETETMFEYGFFEETRRRTGSPTGHLINLQSVQPDFAVSGVVVDDFAETILYLLLILAVVGIIILTMKKKGDKNR